MADRVTLSWRALLRLSLRNLARNPRRTLLTMAVTAIGFAVLTFLSALADGWLRDMQDNFILTLTGDIQVHADGFRDSGDLGTHLRDPEAIGERLAGIAGVRSWTPRIETSGLASVGASSAGVQIVAVDERREPEVTRLHRLVSGEGWFGTALDGCRPVLLGGQLAQNLDAGVGGRVVLMAQDLERGMVSEVFCVKGTIQTGSPQLDYRLVLVPIGVAQSWLGLGQGATGLVVRLSNHEAAERTKTKVQSAMPDGTLEVVAWPEIDPMVRQWTQFSAAYGLVIILVVSALVVVEVLNTMLMALNERSRELVIMGALGTQRREVFAMTLLEGFLLILTGALAGYLIGSAAVLMVDEGLDLSGFSNAFRFFFMSPVIHPVLTLKTATTILATTLVAAILAGVFPAWGAARIDPGELLRSVER